MIVDRDGAVSAIRDVVKLCDPEAIATLRIREQVEHLGVAHGDSKGLWSAFPETVGSRRIAVEINVHMADVFATAEPHVRKVCAPKRLTALEHFDGKPL